MFTRHVSALIIAGMAGTAASTAGAAIIDMQIGGINNAQNNPLSATAQVTTTTDTITIVLSNLTVDMRAADQAISALSFTTSTAPSAALSLTSITGVVRTIKKHGSYSDAGNAPINAWSLTTNSGVYSLSAQLPQYTMVGLPNANDLYANANSSVTNGPHNPHLGSTVTFVLNAPGITENTLISNAAMQFGTEPGSNVFTPTFTTTGNVPEPTSIALFGLGLAMIFRPRKTKAAD